MQGGVYSGISGWLKHSFIDFPGTIATVLFFGGCNLRCPYCHNPKIVDDTEGRVDFDEIIEYVKQRRGIIEGAVFSGGEPTIHRQTLPVIAGCLHDLGLKIKLDTNGLLPDMIKAASPDYLALDIKTLPSRYVELGWKGGDCRDAIGRSLEIVKSMGNDAEVRITVAAPFVGNDEIEAFLSILQGVKKVYLQPFRDSGELLDPSFAERGSVSIETIRQWRNRLAGAVESCEIRGG